MSSLILCVQEDRQVAGAYSDALVEEGYDVQCARDGRGAFEVLRQQPVSLVLLDIYLPRQDGFEILAEIRASPEFREIPVLLLCEGDTTQELIARASSVGAAGIESAPLEVDQLLAKALELAGPPDDKANIVLQTPREGLFRDLPPPELLRSIHVEGLDGVLLLDHGRKKKAIELRSGWPVSVKSNLISECFGNYLVAQGRCTQRDLDESIKRMKTGEGLQGEILVAMDVLSEEQVSSTLREHALEKFLEIFSWRDGRFRIRPGAHVQRGSSVGIDGHPSKLIVEGVRRYFPLKQIDRYLELHASNYLVPLPYESEDLLVVELGEEEHWLCQLDGTDTVGSFLQYPDVIRRTVFGLISIQVLGVQPVVGDPSPTGSTSEESSVVGRSIPPVLRTNRETEEEQRAELARLANRIRDENHYETLGVDFSASDDEIRIAYASLAKGTHPDRFNGASSSIRQLASQVFDRIARAHRAIATASDRKAYAEELTRGRKSKAPEAEGRRALDAETEYQKGQKLIATRDYEGALLCFGRAIENFPSEGEYHSNYGWCLHLCHPDNEVMLGEALEHCRKGVKLAKDREKPYLLLGRLYRAMGRVNAAKKMFTRAVEIRPQCVEAMRELRIMNMRREKDKGVFKRIFRR
jgi:CheY-like chemotaxis protein/tetratricopeptide (TPR) repeat protein